jgi:hypothetical protein
VFRVDDEGRRQTTVEARKLKILRRLVVGFVAAPWVLGIACFIQGRLAFGGVAATALIVDLVLLGFALRRPWGLAAMFLVLRLTLGTIWLATQDLNALGYLFVAAEFIGVVGFLAVKVVARDQVLGSQEWDKLDALDIAEIRRAGKRRAKIERRGYL